MKAISLWQPWASALFAPLPARIFLPRKKLKRHETRHWALPDSCIGREMAIQAAKRDTREEREFWEELMDDDPMGKLYLEAFSEIGIRRYADLPRGCMIGTAVFASPIQTKGQYEDHCERFDIEQDWGNFSLDRFAWPAVTTQLFPNPIPCIGRQGIFDWNPPTVEDLD